MKSYNRFLSSGLLLAIIGLSNVGCAITTTYGVKPKQDAFDQDVYTFTVYYNYFSDDEDIAKNANSQIEKFLSKSEYVDSEILSVFSPQCTGRSLYKVKFYRE